MVHAFVTSRVDYCNSVLHRVSAASVQPLQNVLNATAGIILCKRKFDHITTDVQDRLHWLPIPQRIEYNVCPGVQVSASGCTNIPRWTVLTYVWISQSWSPPFSCSGLPCSSTLQNNEIRPKMFCCFWSNTVEFTSIVCLCSWSITDTDSVLCASKDCYSAEHTKH